MPRATTLVSVSSIENLPKQTKAGLTQPEAHSTSRKLRWRGAGLMMIQTHPNIRLKFQDFQTCRWAKFSIDNNANHATSV
jgi:hypothetical protein